MASSVAKDDSATCTLDKCLCAPTPSRGGTARVSRPFAAGSFSRYRRITCPSVGASFAWENRLGSAMKAERATKCLEDNRSPIIAGGGPLGIETSSHVSG